MVDREFIYKISARDPQINIFQFFITVLGPGRCLDGFLAQFSSRYTPSDTRFMILNFKSAKFHPPAPSQSSQRLSLSSSRPSPSSPRLPWSLPLAGLGPGRDLGRFWRGRELSSTINSSKLEIVGTHPRIPAFPRIPIIRCHRPRLGTTLPHTPGVRMT